MSNLVERLRGCTKEWALGLEAADTLESQAQEIERLRNENTELRRNGLIVIAPTTYTSSPVPVFMPEGTEAKVERLRKVFDAAQELVLNAINEETVWPGHLKDLRAAMEKPA